MKNLIKIINPVFIAMLLIISLIITSSIGLIKVLNESKNNIAVDTVCINTANNRYTISEGGINHIKKYENCSLTAYPDGNGYSIGWGHHTKDVYKDMVITQEVADIYFKNDIKWAEDSANDLLNNLPYTYRFSQSLFDGLVSLIYNAGRSAVINSEFYSRLKNCRVNKDGLMNMSDYDYTIASVKTFKCTHNGNKKRREAEYKLMIYN